MSELDAVPGIEADGYQGDSDKYTLQLLSVVKEGLGMVAASQLKVIVEKFEENHVCRIECQKGSTPIYCDYKDFGVKAFVRYGSSTEEPNSRDWEQWLQEKFDQEV